ncbi:MAG: hypothetical protein ACXW6J_15575 [Candidatus Binatia bacterium]|jgi:hypothetical protein
MDTLADNLLDGAGDTNGAEDTLADDLLDGAEEIAEFLFGNAQKKKKRRRVYHLAATGQLPLARMGSRLIGRKSTLRRHLAEGERAGLQGVK